MAQVILNISTPNDGLGDPLRTAFDEQNGMNTELYTTKVDKETGKGLSTNDFTDLAETKLDGIASNAEVNVQSDWLQADNTQDDFIKNKPTFPFIPEFFRDRIIALGDAVLVGNDVTFSIGYIWDIDNTVYQNASAIIRNIPDATAAFYRTDVAYLDTNNDILIALGTESAIVTPEPAIPIDTLRLMAFNVFGAVITPEPPTFVTTFTELTDTPSTYAGQGTKKVVVKSDESGLEFVADTSGGAPTLQEVLDNNHDLVDGIFNAGTGAGISNTGSDVNFLGSNAGYANTGNDVNSLGRNAGYNNTGSDVNAFGADAGFANTGSTVNFIGVLAGYNNTGSDVNAFGTDAGNANAGNNVNSLGNGAGYANTGNNVNSLGSYAGNGNIFNNVNLFGNSATADEDGQTVFSKSSSIWARLSTLLLTATRKYILPDASGTIALTSDIPPAITIDTTIIDGSTNPPDGNAVFDALATKVDKNSAITGATKTKITYDAKGLVTSGADATLAELTDDVTHRTVTDAQIASWNATIGGSIFQSVWNASTNTPTLTSSVGTKGFYYIVNVDGATNLNGITDWKVGDWAIFDGSVWRKVDNTDAVSSVNGLSGAVSLDSSNVPDTLNKRYITDAQLVVVGNTSNTNTGDETNASIQTKRPLKTIEGQSLEGSGNIDLTKSDVGLANVDNTSDVNKPVSTATQSALDLKATISSGLNNYLQKQSASQTLSNSSLYDDGTNVGLGTTTPTSRFHLTSNAIGQIPSLSASLLLENTTAAVSSVTNQQAPSIYQSSQGWSSTSIASQNTTWRTSAYSLTPLTIPEMYLEFSASRAGNAYISAGYFKIDRFGQPLFYTPTIETLTIVGLTKSTVTVSNTSTSQNPITVTSIAPYTHTTGETNNILSTLNASPTSGTSTFNGIKLLGTINQTGGANGITRGLYINPTLTSAFDFRAIETTAGKVVFASTNTTAGTTGAQTINKTSGSVNFAAGASTLVVTNNLASTTSQIFVTVYGTDATAISARVTRAAGSFTITLNAAATAETAVGFLVIN